MSNTAQRFREFKMPDVGEGLTEAEILKWYVKVGDTVTDGQSVCEVETAKAAVELPIPFDGVVHELRYDEGVTVDVGTTIISVDTQPGAGPAEPASEQAAGQSEGQPAGQPAAGAAGAAEGAEPEQQGRQAVLVGYGAAPSSTKRRPRKAQAGEQAGQQAGQPSVASALQAELNGHAAAPQAPAAPAPAAVQPPAAPTVPAASAFAAPQALGGGARPLAKPPVRKLAKDLGIDLATIAPTGADGVITREDVHAAASADSRPAEAAAPAAPAASALAEEGQPAVAGGERRVPIKGVRKAIAQAMVTSAFTAPHVTEFITLDVTRTMKLVQELKQDPEMAGLRINPLLLVAKAFLLAIKRNPEVSAAWDEANQEIVHKDYVNLGIAAATPRGLIVPNVKDAGRKTLPELATALSELVTTAREGKTTPAAMSGGTVTITNVGVFGVDTGTPILNPGESAILAVGAIKLQPWVHKGKVKPRQVTTLALSFDHRLVDGELGSKVLADVAAVLEDPGKRLITWG
ncbi:dihydrolipoamide acetyltransferase family protein [Streptomyces zagrosensis]|uniref:Dihydrolipoamide acetyltransferase component of pyruvate dehydrogenase complex n=1 Tax=Streptomyces zagrosensis TaxID=1042984 RepID=A0A7W9UWK6_9ACTN|nr:dihydrolipoamide acetyltransferase family protein [Streptomyces zagrosensis]MBB5934020.1 pyruvate dehydrogenase E2 component (dihydrolipoamide acetyltransferase) [Streptomyces zagrosensis]